EKLAESTKVQARINFVNFLCSVLSGTNLPSREEIIQLSEEFNKLNYNATASEILLNYAGYQLKRGLVDDAFTVINYNALISFSEKNKHFAAWRELLLGIISETEAIQNIKSPVDYYTKAMQKVEELSIFEITWQIMFALAKYFISRGNKNKSEQYVVYTKKLIFRIADNLPNPEIRNEYLSESSRKETLEFLENID
ncbi:MAG: hypothetical protein KJ799_06390, partial [Bacteroidetes bacterium]|nr:hypothetical protein [Bacteroidota bacterium]